MRIPPSSLVMGAVVAGLFVLAIRDSNRGRAEQLDLTGEKARERELVDRLRRERDAREAAVRAREAERDARLDSLLGKTPGTPGPFFDGITLGAPMEAFQTEEARQRVYDAMTDHFVEVSFRGVDRLYALHVDVPYSICDRAHSRLAKVWRPAIDDTWLDATTHVRASFSAANCTLEFTPYIEPSDWVARLPFDAIGKADVFVPDGMPGIGRGHGYTAISTERDENGRVSFINVVAYTDVATQEAIRSAIGSRPNVRFDASGGPRFSVQIGTSPWQ
jgi:hypothetical protein